MQFIQCDSASIAVFPTWNLTLVLAIDNDPELLQMRLLGRLLMGKESTQEQVLRASKEIAVKFIEVGRLSPSNFGETFKNIYDAIDATVRGVPADSSGSIADS
jgi:hypothetical protein